MFCLKLAENQFMYFHVRYIYQNPENSFIINESDSVGDIPYNIENKEGSQPILFLRNWEFTNDTI